MKSSESPATDLVFCGKFTGLHTLQIVHFPKTQPTSLETRLTSSMLFAIGIKDQHTESSL